MVASRREISICMCTYNGDKYIEEQLDSILNQSYIHLVKELIICDDKSIDKTLSILYSYKNKERRIKIYSNKSQIGIKKNFEQVLKLSTGNIIVLCDQDDIWKPEKLENLINKSNILKSQPSIHVHNASIINHKSELIESDFMKSRGGFNSSICSNFYKNRYLGCCLAFNRKALEIALPFPSLLPQHDIWIGIIGSIASNVTYSNCSYTLYRRHNYNASTASKNKSNNILKIIFYRITFLYCLIILLFRLSPVNYFKSFTTKVNKGIK